MRSGTNDMILCVMMVLAMRVSAAGVEAQPVVRRPRLRVVTVSGGAEEVTRGCQDGDANPFRHRPGRGAHAPGGQWFPCHHSARGAPPGRAGDATRNAVGWHGAALRARRHHSGAARRWAGTV